MKTIAAGRLPAAPERLHRLSLDQYHRLIASGVFRPSDRLVLLDGLLVDKMTKGPRHCNACEACWRMIDAALPGGGWHARKGDPITLSDGPEGVGSEPEPDVAVVAGPFGTYRQRQPGPGEVALVIEVADTTLPDDRAALRRYAWAGILCVWIVNLTNDTVEVYSGPSGPRDDAGYAWSAVKKPGDVLTIELPGRDGGAPAGPLGPFAVDAILA